MFLSKTEKFNLLFPDLMPHYCNHFMSKLTFKLVYYSRPPVAYWNPALSARPGVWSVHGLSGFVSRPLAIPKPKLVEVRNGKKLAYRY